MSVCCKYDLLCQCPALTLGVMCSWSLVSMVVQVVSVTTCRLKSHFNPAKFDHETLA